MFEGVGAQVALILTMPTTFGPDGPTMRPRVALTPRPRVQRAAAAATLRATALQALMAAAEDLACPRPIN